ncbi:MAG: rane protein [Epulopiscium sp.]|uniref:YihY/virulence factor BrkB family protein n=1 Tax=Defluviitalea raffinosedens TaxID=1450156 RepID=UPI00131E02A1|nr:YihY/virulence factor BrkB family protein [Defluviitalea raffinosedens]MBM7684589.1 membrane protein [Defluviitalea raffinosedens]MBZ4667324.1 YihY/virulence factor BrkB family protein [Defluviitaleaceae bacterium]MDK2787620.1 rane protein [Candidatus Epulonipiscium sp.]HHW68310.1 YihY/virulence factor BrkB family protein [Candidatus Epulonipiscium sp.]
MKHPKLSVIIKDLYCRFYDDEVTALGAQLTFYLVLSFFPFLIFVLSILSYTPITFDSFLMNLSGILPHEAYYAVYQTIEEIMAGGNHTLLSLGMITTLWSASNGVNALIRGLNKAYDAEETRSFLRIRGISLFFTLVIAISILFSLGLIVFGETIGRSLFSHMGLSPWFKTLWGLFRYFIIIITLVLVLMCVYRYMPNHHLSFKDVIPGTLFSALIWIVISSVFSAYVNNFGKFNMMYGSIGGIIVLLLWLYLSSIVILLGGELNGTLIFLKQGKSKPYCKKFGFSLPFMRQN